MPVGIRYRCVGGESAAVRYRCVGGEGCGGGGEGGGACVYTCVGVCVVLASMHDLQGLEAGHRLTEMFFTCL